MTHLRRLCLALGTTLAGCEGTPGVGIVGGGTFVLAVGEEELRVRIDDEALAERARRMIAGLEQQQVVSGDLARGSGGFNTGYRWHLKPPSIALVDATTELCDGRPSEVEAAVDHWVDTVKRYCPWSGRFVSELD